MSVYHEGNGVTLHHGDCLDVLRTLPDASVDSVVTDPPYGLEFMGKDWDAPWKASSVGRGVRVEAERADEMTERGKGHATAGGPYLAARVDSVRVAGLPFQEWCEAWATECLRVLKPGGHLLAFGGTRTWHRLACAVEDAGFEVRDSIAWMYGSGFPKSLDVSKAIDKGTGENRARQLECTSWMRSTGITAAQINAATDSFMGSHYLTDRAQAAIPTADMFDRLRPLLPEVPERIERLVAERTGIEWTDYVKRPVIGKRTTGLGTGRGEVAYISDGENRDVTAPATPAAERWQGWGTALKPAFEPIVVARKPLMAPDVNVLAAVEWELRNQFGESEIRWTSRPASAAARSARPTSSSSTEAPQTAGASAAHADASATPSGEKPTDSGSATSTAHGATPTVSTSAPTPDARQPSSGQKSSTPTATPAPAATSAPPTSSPSTTSTGAGPLTDERPGERSTRKSSEKDSPTDTGSCVGTATGLTGSRAHVLIERLPDGSFVWPEGLPKYVKGGPLTVAANVLTHGTGALNVDGCRIGSGKVQTAAGSTKGAWIGPVPAGEYVAGTGREYREGGRWPANVILDESQAEALDEMSGETTSPSTVTRGGRRNGDTSGLGGLGRQERVAAPGDTGGASRFFYIAKADANERPRVNGTAHPTVKPLALMRWLVRLVTPPGGTVLEPFAGSGTTVEACLLEGFQCIAIEKTDEYLPLILARLHRQRDPVAAIKLADDDLGLFDLEGMGA